MRKVSKTTAVATGVLLILGSANAGPKDYAKHHKRLLVSDVIYVLGSLAPAGASVHCQHVPAAYGTCNETDPLLPTHPSNARYWGAASALAVGEVTLNHLLFHFGDGDPIRRNLGVFLSVPFGIGMAYDSYTDVATAEYLENRKHSDSSAADRLKKARARLLAN
jgi:hypothetical protein